MQDKEIFLLVRNHYKKHRPQGLYAYVKAAGPKPSETIVNQRKASARKLLAALLPSRFTPNCAHNAKQKNFSHPQIGK